jgi:hypothetical protein
MHPATPTHSYAHRPRPVSRGMRTLLYVLTALTFIAGTQLVVLGVHTATFFAWTIDPPLSATFIGAGFWSASTVVFWCARQRDWARARVIVPTVAVVASMLLVATWQHLELFHGLFGLAWIEIYAFFPPILAALTIQQLAASGHVTRGAERLPAPLRLTLAAQAATALAVGALLFVSPSVAASIWAWELGDLTSKAIGTWLVGTGITCGLIAALDDRSALPGWALAQMVLGGTVLLGLARYANDLDLAGPSAYLLVTYMLATLASGSYGAVLAQREGRFTPTTGLGGIPVELRAPAAGPAPAQLPVPNGRRASVRP